MPHEGTEDILTRALRCAVGVVLSAESPVSDHDRREAIILVQRYANVPYNSGNLALDLAESNQLLVRLKKLATSLNPHGRSTVFHASATLVGGPGSLAGDRTAALQSVADALSVSAAIDGPIRIKGGQSALLAS